MNQKFKIFISKYMIYFTPSMKSKSLFLSVDAILVYKMDENDLQLRYQFSALFIVDRNYG